MNEKLIELVREEQQASNDRFDYLCNKLSEGMNFLTIINSKEFDKLADYCEFTHNRVNKYAHSIFMNSNHKEMQSFLKQLKEQDFVKFKQSCDYALGKMSEEEKKELFTMLDKDTFDFLFETEGVAI